MPIAASIIAAIITAAATATEIGVQVSGAGQPSSSPAKSTTTTPLTASQNQSQTAAVTQQLPNLQSLTGGSLSPEYAAQFGATQSGVANDPQATGNIQSAINQFFGLTAPGTTGLTSSSSAPSGSGGGIADLLKSGGSGSPMTGGSPSLQNWIQQQLQGNDFKGLVG